MLRQMFSGLSLLGLVAGSLLAPAALAKSKAPEVIGTGETVHCLKTTRIKSTRVVDDRTILFFTKGRDVYRNVMETRCASLDFYQSFIYRAHNMEVCDTDYIEVFQGAGGINGPICGLNEFERVEIVKPQGRAAMR